MTDSHILPPDLRPHEVPICRPVSLHPDLVIDAARVAIEHNPVNAPFLSASARDMLPSHIPTPFHLAVMTGKNFRAGTTITVQFLEDVSPALRARILSHMKAWETSANINFVPAPAGQPGMVRVTLRGDGYWSYIGTDILSVPANQPTMSLQDFDNPAMPESEFHRVVRHETGHTLGFPHEHARIQIVSLLDPQKTISYFKVTQGWDEQTIRDQILTPLSEASIMGTPNAETDSCMCYQFPGACTRNGQPIPGGLDITPDDYAFAAKVYPGRSAPSGPTPPGPSPPPGPGVGTGAALLDAHNAARKAANLPPFHANGLLGKVARDHAAWMAANNSLTHSGADGSYLDRIRASGYDFTAASENVGKGERSVAEVMAAWLGSPEHKADILGPYRDYGGAVAIGADGTPWWCSAFGSPASSAPPVNPPGNPPVTPPASTTPRLRGYVPTDPVKTPRPFVVYVKGADGNEVGYRYLGTFRHAEKDPTTLMFDGPAEVVR
jgi:uncharacterized protein YkwD